MSVKAVENRVFPRWTQTAKCAHSDGPGAAPPRRRQHDLGRGVCAAPAIGCEVDRLWTCGVRVSRQEQREVDCSRTMTDGREGGNPEW